MKKIVLALVVLVIAFAAYSFISNKKETVNMETVPEETQNPEAGGVGLYPIKHASFVLMWAGKVIYVDPVGELELLSQQPEPDIILITDIHSDHLDVDTLTEVIADKTVLVVPQAVADELPANMLAKATIIGNGETTNQAGFTIEAVPMYNLPETADAFHVKGRGNGYVVENTGMRVYIAGDTSVTPEMKSLENINMAFIPMNLPYTMSVEDAAEGVLAFAPKQVFPYHYRGTDGLSDIEKFKELVDAGEKDIEVVLLNWYQEPLPAEEVAE